MNNIIDINNLSKDYYTLKCQVSVLDNINLSIFKNEFVAIIGPSGCGKSTLLSIIGGTIKDYEGFVNAKGTISYMFQDDALFPWLTVKDNILLGIENEKKKDPKKIEHALYLASNYGLKDYLNKYPNELSGGMKERVALIRTIATMPNIILLDEPFRSLDYQTRKFISNDVYDIVKREKLTAVMVTHDLEEAITLADRIIVLSEKPSKIKNIYDVSIDKNLSPIKRKETLEYTTLYQSLWDDLVNG